MQSQWDTLQRLAKKLEARLEKYSAVGQRINADIWCDEERPLVESKEEQELASEIEQDLQELAGCINNMRSCSTQLSPTTFHQQDILIKRYSEIHFDCTNEFKNIAATVQRKRESMELFHNSRDSHNEQDSSTTRLLRERNSIVASIRSVNEVFREALEVKTALGNQRNILSGASGGLSGLVATVPSFNRLIDGIQKKNAKETMTIAIVVSGLIIFCIWWLFLR